MSVPITNTTTGSNNLTFSDTNVLTGTITAVQSGALTLGNSNGVSTTITADGNGNLRWGATVDGAIYKNHIFSKPDLEEKIKQFHLGKYTRKYMEVYLDFMVMNAMLDNLEYLEYKVSLDKGQQ